MTGAISPLRRQARPGQHLGDCKLQPMSQWILQPTDSFAVNPKMFECGICWDTSCAELRYVSVSCHAWVLLMSNRPLCIVLLLVLVEVDYEGGSILLHMQSENRWCTNTGQRVWVGVVRCNSWRGSFVAVCQAGSLYLAWCHFWKHWINRVGCGLWVCVCSTVTILW
jgi:hypothetical protein